jgi:hypothetical protein
MPDLTHDLHFFMRQIANDIAVDYERIHQRSKEDHGTAGAQGEKEWAELLANWLPSTYHVVLGGRIISADGEMSPQVDIAVLKPSYPRALLREKIWLACGIAAVFECKNTLKVEHVIDNIERCKKIKAMFPREVSDDAEQELRSPIICGLLAHSHSWKGVNSKPLEIVGNALLKGAYEASHPSELIDVVCVADLATWNNWHFSGHPPPFGDQGKAIRLFYGGDWGVDTWINCAAVHQEPQSTHFQPVGAALAHITERLSHRDSSVADLAEYFRKANLFGSGRAGVRYWPQSVHSVATRDSMNRAFGRAYPGRTSKPST